MKHDPAIYFHILALEILDPPAWEPPPQPDFWEVVKGTGLDISPEQARKLTSYRPDFQTSKGLIRAGLDKFGVADGVPFGIYKGTLKVGSTRHEYAWLCRLVDGFMVPDVTFSVRVIN